MTSRVFFFIFAPSNGLRVMRSGLSKSLYSLTDFAVSISPPTLLAFIEPRLTATCCAFSSDVLAIAITVVPEAVLAAVAEMNGTEPSSILCIFPPLTLRVDVCMSSGTYVAFWNGVYILKTWYVGVSTMCPVPFVSVSIMLCSTLTICAMFAILTRSVYLWKIFSERAATMASRMVFCW